MEKIKSLRKPKVNWIDFLNFDVIKVKLYTLNENSKPIFGSMNAQQMIEHLSAVTQIANLNWNLDVYVSDEKTARRKPFLNTENELQTGFKASFLSDEPIGLNFSSIHLAIDDLLHQLELFVKVFTEDEHKTVVHPFFGSLDFEAWKKFQVKHFTHHFKQFGLL